MDHPPSPRSRRRGFPLRAARRPSSPRGPASPRTPPSLQGKPPLSPRSPANKPPPSPKEASKGNKSNVTVHDKIWSDLKEAFVLGEKRVELEKQLSPRRSRRTARKKVPDEIDDCETSSTSSTSSSSSSVSQDTQVHVDDLNYVTDTNQSPSDEKGSSGVKVDDLKDVKDAGCNKTQRDVMKSQPEERVKGSKMKLRKSDPIKDINHNEDKGTTKMSWQNKGETHHIARQPISKTLRNEKDGNTWDNKENHLPDSRFSYPRACLTLDTKIRNPKPSLDLSLSHSTPSLAAQGFSVRDIQGELQRERKFGSLEFQDRGKSGSLNVVSSPACKMASASPVTPRKVTGIENNIFFRANSTDGIVKRTDQTGGEEDDGYESQMSNNQFNPKIFSAVQHRPEINTIRNSTRSKNDVSAPHIPASDRSVSSAKSIKHANGVANACAKGKTNGAQENTVKQKMKEVTILAAPVSVKPTDKDPVQGQHNTHPTSLRNADQDLGHKSINSPNIGPRCSNDSVRQNPMTQEFAECADGTRVQLVSQRVGNIKAGPVNGNKLEIGKTEDSQEKRNSSVFVGGNITASPYIPPGKRRSLLATNAATTSKSKQPQRASVTLPVIFSDRKNINRQLASVAQASMHKEKDLGATIVTETEETLATDNKVRDKDEDTAVTNQAGTSQRYAPIGRDNRDTEEAEQKSPITCIVVGDSGSVGRASKHGVGTKMSEDTSRGTGFGSQPGYVGSSPAAREMSAANAQHKNKHSTLTAEPAHVEKLAAGLNAQQDNKLAPNEHVIGRTPRTTPNTHLNSARDDSSPRPPRINYSIIDGAGSANELRPSNSNQVDGSIKQQDGNITPEQNSPSKSDNNETLEEPAEGSPGDTVTERVKKVRFRLNSKNEDIVETDKPEKSAYEKLFGQKFKKSKVKTQKPTGSILVVPKDRNYATEDEDFVVQKPTVEVKTDVDDAGKEKDKITKDKPNTVNQQQSRDQQHAQLQQQQQQQQNDKKPLKQQHQKQPQQQENKPHRQQKQPSQQLSLKQQQPQQHEKQAQQQGQQPLPSPQYLKHHPKQHEKKLPQQPPPQQQEVRHQQQQIHQQQLQQELKNLLQQEQQQQKQRQPHKQQHHKQRQQQEQHQLATQKQPDPKHPPKQQKQQLPQPKQPLQQQQQQHKQPPAQQQHAQPPQQNSGLISRDSEPLKEKQNVSDVRPEEKPKPQLKKIPMDILQGIPQEIFNQTLSNPDAVVTQNGDEEEQYINRAKTKNIMAKLASLQYNNSLGAKYVASPVLTRHLLDPDGQSSRSSSPHTDASYPSQEPWGAASSQNDSLDSSAILATYPEDSSQYGHVTHPDAGLSNQVLPGHPYGMGANHVARSSASSDRTAPYSGYCDSTSEYVTMTNPTDAAYASHMTNNNNSAVGFGHSPQGSFSSYDYPQNPYSEIDSAPPMSRPLSAYELSSAHQTQSQDPQYDTQDRSKPVYASTKDILKMMGTGRRKPEQTSSKYNTYPYK